MAVTSTAAFSGSRGGRDNNSGAAANYPGMCCMGEEVGRPGGRGPL